ncbi:hypothetical protein, partial [Chloroflexus sp.]|uniref:hypothetical protein n=1 Tax=Chloroflexus sp. TaxID=1904827 RepID=UPI002ACDBBC6
MLDYELAGKMVKLSEEVKDRRDFYEKSVEIVRKKLPENTLDKLYNYAYLLKNIDRALKALESGSAEEVEHWLEVIGEVPKDVELSRDEELSKALRSTRCSDVFSSALHISTTVRYSGEDPRNLLRERDIMKLRLCLKVVKDEVIELLINTARSAVERSEGLSRTSPT